MVQARTADAKKTYDELVRTLPGDARALVARGQFRQTRARRSRRRRRRLHARRSSSMPKYPAAYNFLAWAEIDRGRAERGAGGAQEVRRPGADRGQRLRLAGAHGAPARRHRRGDGAGEEGAAGRSQLRRRARGARRRAALQRQGQGGAPLVRRARSPPTIRRSITTARCARRARGCSTAASATASGRWRRRRICRRRPSGRAIRPTRSSSWRACSSIATRSPRRGSRCARRAQALDAPDNAAMLTEGQRRQLSIGGDPRARDGAGGDRRAAARRSRAPTRWAWCSSSPAIRARAQKATALKGWIAARNGDDKAALGDAGAGDAADLAAGLRAGARARRRQGKARAHLRRARAAHGQRSRRAR